MSECFERSAEERSWAVTLFALDRLQFGKVWVLIERFLKDAVKQSENLIALAVVGPFKYLFLVLSRRQNTKNSQMKCENLLLACNVTMDLRAK